MSRCILHFGMYKTGSTSIQRSLHEKLADPRFRYLHFGSANSTGALAMAFLAQPGEFHLSRKLQLDAPALARRRAQVRGALEEQLRALGARTGVLSAESLCGLDAAEFGALAALMAGAGCEPAVAGYVRDPWSYVASDLQQRFKSGTGRFDLNGSWPAYRRRLEKFEAVLGARNVACWRFERGALAHECVVRDFCARTGIAFAPEDVVRANEGLSLPAVQLLYAYRRFGPGFGTGKLALRQNTLLVARLQQLRGPAFRLDPAALAPLVEANRADLEWIEARLDAPFSTRPAANAEAIAGEAGLLALRPDALEWLAQQPEVRPRRWSTVRNPRTVAGAMHELRLAMTGQAARSPRRAQPASGSIEQTPSQPPGGSAMKMNELVTAVVAGAGPGAAKLPEQRVARITAAVLRAVASEIDKAGDGERVQVPGLGTFRVRQATNSKGETGLRIAFQRARTKASADT